MLGIKHAIPALREAGGGSIINTAAFVRHTPLGRIGTPEDVGPLLVYLASDASRHMTGQALVLDGGFTMHELAWADRLDLG